MNPCSEGERAANCLAAVDKLWERCERGVDLVFPNPAEPASKKKRQRAARLLFRLIEAANRLEQTAKANDPVAVQRWSERREAYYSEMGWDWPPSKEVAKETRMELVQLAWDTDQEAGK